MKQILVMRIMMLLVLTIAAVGIGTAIMSQPAHAAWFCAGHPVAGIICGGQGNGPFDQNHDNGGDGDGGGGQDDN